MMRLATKIIDKAKQSKSEGIEEYNKIFKQTKAYRTQKENTDMILEEEGFADIIIKGE